MTTSLLLLLSLVFQAPEPKPLIDNTRVRVWETRPPAGSFEFDTLVVTSSGAVNYFKKGSMAVAAKLVIGLKPVTVAPLPNKSGYPLALPRPGAKLVLDAPQVAVWDYRWTMGVPTPVHFHDKDVVVMFLEDGDLKSTPVSGEPTVNQWKAGTIRFNARDRVHSEELVRGTQRAIIVELK